MGLGRNRTHIRLNIIRLYEMPYNCHILFVYPFTFRMVHVRMLEPYVLVRPIQYMYFSSSKNRYGVSAASVSSANGYVFVCSTAAVAWSFVLSHSTENREMLCAQQTHNVPTKPVSIALKHFPRILTINLKIYRL